MTDVSISSIKSFTSTASKKVSLASLKSSNKNKSTDTVNINPAIPGPGDEIEAEPDAGVVEKEKVSVVFLVSMARVFEVLKVLTKCSASRFHITLLYRQRTTDVRIEVLRHMGWIRLRRRCRECVR